MVLTSISNIIAAKIVFRNGIASGRAFNSKIGSYSRKVRIDTCRVDILRTFAALTTKIWTSRLLED